MMNIVETDRITDAVMLFGAGITDIRAFTAPSGDISIYTISGTGGGQTRFSASTDGTLTLQQELVHANGIAPGKTASLEWIELDGSAFLMLEGAALVGVPGYALSVDGVIGASAPFTGLSSSMVAVASATPDATSFVFASQNTGYFSYSRAGNGALSVVDQLTDGPAAFLDDISDAVAYEIEGVTYLALSSETENAVSVFAVSDIGQFTAKGDIGAADGIGMSAVSAIETATIMGQTFLVVASSGSSAISVLRMTETGAPAIADHVNDDLKTRFSNVTNLDVLEYEGHVFVVATGSDDGFSLLSLLPNGRLVHRASVEDTTTNALSGASAAALWVSDDTLQIAAAGLGDIGLSQFQVDLSTLGSVLTGEGSLLGTVGDDVIVGQARNDTILGGAGDDILVDGEGVDTLTGGSGADLFVLTADGMDDTITDFSPGTDKLDLSAYRLLYDVSQLGIAPTVSGAILTFGLETVTLVRDTNQTITAQDLTTEGILNINRSPLATIPLTLFGDGTDNTLDGGEGDDLIEGGGGVDRLNGFGGNDVVRAGTGNDFVFGGTGADMLYGDAGFDTIHGGEGDDRIEGGAQADTIHGDDGADRLIGEDGVDTIYGGDGQDNIFGNAGNDTLFGGAGQDQIYGGTQEDRLFGDAGDDLIFGEGGFDRLEGGNGEDILDGGNQADNLFGENGNDTLYGGGGFDRLFGGNDNDTLFGQGGPDSLFGEFGNDTLNGGADDDRLFGGQGNDILEGGDGADTLSGDAGFDTINGGSGNDTLQGAFNADTFVFEDGFDKDTIVDFEATNANEFISLVAVSSIANWSDLSSNHMAQSGADVTIDAGSGDGITLLNVSLPDLDAGDFLF